MTPRPSAVRWRAARLLATAVVLALAWAAASRVHLDQDMAALFPDAPGTGGASFRLLEPMLQRLVIDVAACDGGTVSIEEIGSAADELAEELRASGHFESVQSTVDAARALEVIHLLRERTPRLLDAAGLRRVAERIRPEAVRDSIPGLVRRLLEPGGEQLYPDPGRDPLGLTQIPLQSLAALTAGFDGARLSGGRIISEDGRHVLVLARPAFSSSDLERSERMLGDLEAAARRLEAGSGAQVVVRYLGAHRSTLDNARAIERDARRTTVIGGAVIALLVLAVFGRISTVVLAVLPAAFGSVVALAVLWCLGGSVPALVAGFGVVLLGLTVDYAVHVIYRSSRPEGALRPPYAALLLSAATTSAALLALELSSLPVVRQIGLFAAIGIAAAAAFTVVALPAIVSRHTRTRFAVLDPVRLFRAASSGRIRFRAVAAALALTPLAGWGALRLEFEGDLDSLSALSQETRRDEDAIRATWGEAFRASIVLARGPTLEEALQANERVVALLARWQAEGRIREHGSMAGLLPSRATQDARLAAWKEFWSRRRVEELRAEVARAARETPFRAGAFDGFFTWLEAEPPPLVLEDYETGPLADALGERVLHAGGEVAVATPVFLPAGGSAPEMARSLGEAVPGALWIDRKGMVQELAGRVLEEMEVLAVVAFAAVAVLVTAWLGRMALALVVLLPLLVSLLWTLGLLGWLGIEITLTNAIFVVFLFGAAVDYSIFILMSHVDRFRTGVDATGESRAAVLLSAATTLAGFGALSLAGHPVLFSIGITGVAGIASSLVAIQLFVPAIAGAILRSPGPNGTAGFREAWGAIWTLAVLGGGGLWFLSVRRWFVAPEDRQRAAIDAIRAMSIRIRRHLPLGRRVYLDEERARGFGPGVIVANHESMYDIVAILALPLPVEILVKRWVWRAPIVGGMVRAAGYILVDDTPPGEVVERARKSMDRGHSILVFPEGRRTRDGAVARFHKGAFAIAEELGARVLPIALVNTRTVTRRGSWWIGPHDVRVALLEPMDPRDFPGDDGARRMASAARRRIRERCDALWLGTQEGEAWKRTIAGLYRYLGPVIGHYAASKVHRDSLVEALPRLARGSGDIVVVGCGYGIMTVRLALAFPERRILAVDRDERKVEIVRSVTQELAGVTVVAGDGLDVDLGTPELALLADVLHYSPAEAQRTLLERLGAALPPGGRLIVRDGCSDASRSHRLVEAGENLARLLRFTRAEGKFHFLTQDAWCTMLGESGFNVEECPPELALLSNRVFLCRRRGPSVPGPAQSENTSPGPTGPSRWNL